MPRNEPSTVYFIRRGRGPIKIGIAGDVFARARALQTAHAEPLNIVATMDGGTAREKEIHGRFVEHRLNGEWFRPHTTLLEFIAAKATPWGGRAMAQHLSRRKNGHTILTESSASTLLSQLRDLVRRDARPDRQIAIAAGIHPQTFSAFMHKRRGLSVDTAEELAKVLGSPLTLSVAAPKRPARPRKPA